MVMQYATPHADEGTGVGHTFTGWAGDGPGRIAFAIEANTVVGRTIFDKNRCIDGDCHFVEKIDVL